MCKSLFRPLSPALDLEETELAVVASQIALSSPLDFSTEGLWQAVAHIHPNVAAHGSSTCVHRPTRCRCLHSRINTSGTLVCQRRKRKRSRDATRAPRSDPRPSVPPAAPTIANTASSVPSAAQLFSGIVPSVASKSPSLMISATAVRAQTHRRPSRGDAVNAVASRTRKPPQRVYSAGLVSWLSALVAAPRTRPRSTSVPGVASTTLVS